MLDHPYNRTMRLTACCCLLLTAVCATAAEEPSAASQPMLPALDVPRLAQAPVIDGRLDEPGWAQAAVVPELHPALGLPDASAGIGLQTRVRIAWRPEALYLGVECRDDAVLASAGRPRDDDLYNEDAVEFFIDAVGDGRAYWEVQVSPLGQVTDFLHLLTAPPEFLPTGRFTSAFNTRDHFSLRACDLPGLTVAAARGADGWTVEAALPAEPLLKRLALKALVPLTLHLQVMRYDWSGPRSDAARVLHQANWVPVLSGCPHLSPLRMGQLVLRDASSAASQPSQAQPSQAQPSP